MKEKFTNVFELLSEAECTGREAEVRWDTGPGWYPISSFASVNLQKLKERFGSGNLRLKPKLKTVEGWITVVPHKHAYLAVHPFAVPGQSLFRSREDALSMLGGIGVVAKVTFEVEE